MRRIRWAWSLALVVAGLAQVPAGGVDFTGEVRPILAAHCFKCHGPDEGARQAKLRLDERSFALAPAESGTRAIVPGKPDESELIRRVLSSDADEQMPPPSAKKPLSLAQKKILRDWISNGAEYRPHWAFVPPVRPARPKVQATDWPRNAIDDFTLAAMEKAGLSPSPLADRATLIRRVSLDLVGYGPTPAEVDAFVADASPDAYERLVDRLLASPAYGERWARKWLDLARYADTNGYEKDRPRTMWPYREWVIAALNRDMPFDQFTREQLAGDMLPGATLAQRIATGFHRNTMLNEEGGIDPLEYRFHAMVDRVNTTGTIWLGLTLGCAQCHTHKFDPIAQKDYYRFMAFLNNADEPRMPLPDPAVSKRGAEVAAQIARMEADLANQFPPDGPMTWQTAVAISRTTESGAELRPLEDGSILVVGKSAEKDVYTLSFDTTLAEVIAMRLEALPNPSLPAGGPGRKSAHFQVTEIAIERTAPGAKPVPVRPERATSSHAAPRFPLELALDGNSETGWVPLNAAPSGPVSATFWFAEPLADSIRSRWIVRIEQKGEPHRTLGRFRISLGRFADDGRTIADLRREHKSRRFAEWLVAEQAHAVRWNVLRPTAVAASLPVLTVEADDAVFVTGDQSKSDTYTVSFGPLRQKVTAIRLEALADDRLPEGGPGRVDYEGPFGDFVLSEISLMKAGKKVPFQRGTQSYASGANTAAAAIDGNPQTGWSIDGAQGRSHSAVFNLQQPLEPGQSFELTMLFEKHYSANLGRFRISVTGDDRATARGLSPEMENLLLLPVGQRTYADVARLEAFFLSVAPELAGPRSRIRAVRDTMPRLSEVLVFVERPKNHPRPTYLHRRGEFLQPTDRVTPEVPEVFPPLAADNPRDRIALANWLVRPDNALVGRVTMNRQWAAFFGRGIVRTLEDFGYQGESPTHPALLDWLAVEFAESGWSMKRMHRLLVTSATYRQSSKTTPEHLAKDPANRFLARFPRVRLEAEAIRDSLLRAAGLLCERVGGPSVFPPQPAGVSSEGAYGPLAWHTSTGSDRYRRGLYTFAKRTAPFAMATTFDAPSGEACVVRREASNTPLQALTLLNDVVFAEMAQAMGRDLAGRPGPDSARIELLFRRLVARKPTPEEAAAMGKYLARQRDRLARKELDAAAIAGSATNAPECAAWTLAARAAQNLDECVTKE